MSREVIIIIILGVFFLVVALSAPISRSITKKKGEKFLEEHQDAVKIYSAILKRGRMEYRLHKSFKGKYSRFVEGKNKGLLLIPEQPYNILLQCVYGDGNRTITASLRYDDFAVEAGKTYIASYDIETKVFTLVEGKPEV